MANFPKVDVVSLHQLIQFKLIRTTKRLTFGIDWMLPELIYRGEDDGDYYSFIASNGYQIISRSRMDIQTERLWLLGSKSDTAEGARSGSMVFSDDIKRNKAEAEFMKALNEWRIFVTND